MAPGGPDLDSVAGQVHEGVVEDQALTSAAKGACNDKGACNAKKQASLPTAETAATRPAWTHTHTHGEQNKARDRDDSNTPTTRALRRKPSDAGAEPRQATRAASAQVPLMSDESHGLWGDGGGGGRKHAGLCHRQCSSHYYGH